MSSDEKVMTQYVEVMFNLCLTVYYDVAMPHECPGKTFASLNRKSELSNQHDYFFNFYQIKIAMLGTNLGIQLYFNFCPFLPQNID